MLRMKEGIKDSAGTTFVPEVVRVGAEQSVNLNVRDMFVDELVDKRLNGIVGSDTSSDLAQRINALRRDLDTIKASRLEKQKELEQLAGGNAARINVLDIELRELKRTNQEKSIQLQDAKDKQTQSSRAMDAARKKARMDILSEADVICATLSGSGHDYMSALDFDFDTVIIDEAAQSVELSSLIPLKYGCRRCILVGGVLCLLAFSVAGDS